MAALQNFVARRLPTISAAWLNLVDKIKVTFDVNAAETTAGVTPLTTGYPFSPIRDISRYVSDNTGVTDVRAQFQAAINVAKNEICVPDGTYLINGSLNPLSGTGIFGNGQNTILKLANNANVPVIQFSASNLDAVDVHLRDFTIDGNKANQTSANTHGIFLTNVTGTSSLLARHRINRLYIHSCKGDGIQLGFAMRDSFVDGLAIYHCDGRGMFLGSFSDSIVTNCNIGQSGLFGFSISGSGAIQVANIKSWFSGRLGDAGGTGPGGLNGDGFRIRNSSGFIGRNLNSQENEGHGFRVFGDGVTIKDIDIQGFVSDSDNKEGDNVPGATSFAALSLDSVEASTFRGRVSKFTGSAGTVQYGIVGANVGDNVTIDMDIDPAAVLSFLSNIVIANNVNVRVNQSQRGNETNGNVAATLILGTDSHTQIWNTPITADRAVTLTTARAWRGGEYRIVRTAAATGAFNLNVGTGPLKALAAGEWCTVEFNGTAWVLTGFGAL